MILTVLLTIYAGVNVINTLIFSLSYLEVKGNRKINDNFNYIYLIKHNNMNLFGKIILTVYIITFSNFIILLRYITIFLYWSTHVSINKNKGL